MYDTELAAAVGAMVEHIKADYATWSNRAPANDAVAVKIRQDMISRFNLSVHFEVGSKYVKVVTGGSVHCFVVLKDTAKFKRGDILKAASWKAPATNFARGNVLSGNLSRVTWTGAL